MRQDAQPVLLSAASTLFFVDGSNGLLQGYDVSLRNPGSPFEDRLVVRWQDREFCSEPFFVDSGESTVRVFIPDIREPAELHLSLARSHSQPLVVRHKPRRHWTVHLIQFAHHDLGYTDLPSNVLREYCSFYDRVLEFCRETDRFPEESKFRYTIEQGWSLLHYLEHRPPEVCSEVIRRIKEGRIEVNALLGNMITELLGPEQMIRLLYPVYELKRKYGIPVVCAEHNDIPGISWGLAAALAAAGIKWFAPALPDYFRWHDMNFHTFWDEDRIAPGGIPHAFYWQAPAGQKVLFWYGRQGAGGDVDLRLNRVVPYLEELEQRGYPYDVLRYLIMGGFRDNAPPRLEFALTALEWNSKYAYPKLVPSLNARFFPDLEQRLGPDVPIYRGELPGTDYPIGACSTAYFSSLNRITHDQLLIAERLASAASVLCGFEYPDQTLKEAYYCTLIGDEHTWGLAHPTGPGQEACVAQLSEYPCRAAALSHDVLTKAINDVADCIARDEDGLYVLVFNPLSWRRTDVARVPAKLAEPCGRPMYPVPGQSEQDPRFAILAAYPVRQRHLVEIPHTLLRAGVEVIDLETGRAVPHEVYEITGPSAPVPYAAQRYSLGQFNPQELLELRFLAQDVPACGWKLYKLRPAAQETPRASCSVSSAAVLENQFYRVELDEESGCVRSIFDKEASRELVDATSGRFLNQIVVRSALNGRVTSSGRAVFEGRRSSPVSESAVIRTCADGCPQIVQEITLYHHVKRIDIANRLLKDSTPMLETYFAFPFALKNPRFTYEGSLCRVEAFKDQFPGSNTDYYAVQHWAEISDGEISIILTSLDAPVMQFGDNWPLYVSQAHHGVMPPGFDHPFHKPEDVTKAHVYSLVLLNNFRTNFSPAQCADLLFRYCLTSGVGIKAPEFGYSAALPLASAAVQGRTRGSLPKCASFCQVEPSDVLLLTVKRAEDGNGLIVRLLETQGRAAEFLLTLPLFKIREAYLANAVEDTVGRAELLKDDTVRAFIEAYEVVTLRLLIA
ncbi:MAG: glycoside hydrolase family 38 C-terminal domain-containing protein [Armatimonadota bacterium]|nr:glycoside hydrolase family 38 C-terminal domain-containing protein [Armatimonadota bacterium]